MTKRFKKQTTSFWFAVNETLDTEDDRQRERNDEIVHPVVNDLYERVVTGLFEQPFSHVRLHPDDEFKVEAFELFENDGLADNKQGFWASPISLFSQKALTPEQIQLVADFMVRVAADACAAMNVPVRLLQVSQANVYEVTEHVDHVPITTT